MSSPGATYAPAPRPPGGWHLPPAARAAAGGAALAMAMGVGRFAYTALLPSLQGGLGLDDAAGGLIASVNLTGYLAGVLWARRTPPGGPRVALMRSGLLLGVLATAATPAAGGAVALGVLRFLAGVASGLVFVLVSAAVLETLPPGREGLSGVLFGGVGCGIALSGAVAALAAPGGWQRPWLLLGAASLALALPALAMAPGAQVVRPRLEDGPGQGEVAFGRLAVAYALEGFGYIVSGTFAVLAVQRLPGLSSLAPWVWVAAGLAAAPSALVWGAAARRLGSRRALLLAYAAQAIGMALPAVSPAAWAALAGALLFGGTFIGIVTMTMDLARRLVPEATGRAIGSLTALYGVGQAVAPWLAGRLSHAAGSPGPAVLAGAAVVAAGAAVLALPPGRR